MLVHIIRHGETIWHADSRYAGVSDIPLSQRGREQVSVLTAWARSANIDAVISSQMVRAKNTAEPLAKAAGLTLTTEKNLREVDFGDGEGLTAEEMSQRFPAQRSAFISSPARVALPNGEPGVDALARALPVVLEHLRKPPVESIVFVIHSTLGRLLLCDLLGINHDSYRQVFPSLTNCFVSTLRITKPKEQESVSGTAGLVALNVGPPFAGPQDRGATFPTN